MLINLLAIIAILGWMILGVLLVGKKSSIMVNIAFVVSFIALVIAFIK